MWLRCALVVGFALSSLSFPVGKLPDPSLASLNRAATLALPVPDIAEPASRLAQLIRRAAGRTQQVGIAVISLSSDSLVLARNATTPMVPASNQKLLVTAAAWPDWDEALVGALSLKPPTARTPRAKPAPRGRRNAPNDRRASAVVAAANSTVKTNPLFDFPEKDSVTGLVGYDVLCRIHKWSDNQLAKRVLAALSARTRMSGQEVVRHDLDSLGVWSGGLNVVDGSGRSPKNRVAPLTIAQVLRAMYTAPRHEAFINSLARAGSEGTLRRHPLGLGPRVVAKTGSINGTFSLSGYLFGEQDTFAFSILLNQWYDKAAAFRFFGELLCALDQREPPASRPARLASVGSRHRSRMKRGVR